jgi:Ni,Fe-hydrogenase I large subunit
MRGLDVLDADPARQTAGLHQLASSLVADPEFVQRPTWLGQCAENGPWSRLRHRQAQAVVAHSAWTRLSARWLELVEIAAADPYHPEQGRMPLLASGALQLAAGQALAWVEMARGLLFHWVQLDPAGAVQDYRVLAPTEWNFHPQGALAQALSALPVGETVAASTLAAAFDPCVACTV